MSDNTERFQNRIAELESKVAEYHDALEAKQQRVYALEGKVKELESALRLLTK